MRSRLPLVISITALVVALLGWTGIGEATRNALVPKNSVGSAQIKNRSIKPVDLAASTKRNLKGKRGPQGPQGSQGPRGPAGRAGSDANLKGCVNSNFDDVESFMRTGTRPFFFPTTC